MSEPSQAKETAQFDALTEKALAFTRGDDLASCCVAHNIQPVAPITEVCSPKVAEWLLRQRLQAAAAKEAELVELEAEAKEWREAIALVNDAGVLRGYSTGTPMRMAQMLIKLAAAGEG